VREEELAAPQEDGAAFAHGAGEIVERICGLGQLVGAQAL
jgi:hypothetical protein